MAYIAVTYSFSNGTTSDATQVNTNFTDLINGLSDGTKDLNMNAATFAGNVTMNGNVTLGNASGDDVTVTGSLAASLIPKTAGTYDLGSTTKGWASMYLWGNSKYLKLAAHATQSANMVLVFPISVGSANQVMITDGSGNLSFTSALASAATASTTMTRDSNINTYVNNISSNIGSTVSAAGTLTLTVASGRTQFITGSSSHTVKMPDCTTLTGGFEFVVKNNSTSTTGVTLVNSASTTLGIMAPGTIATLTCTDNSSAAGAWNVSITGGSTYTPTNTGVNSGVTTLTLYVTRYQQSDSNITVAGFLNLAASATTGSNFTITLPLAFNITNQNECNGTAVIDNAGGTTRVGAMILGDATYDGAIFYVTAPSTSTSNMPFIFNYKVY